MWQKLLTLLRAGIAGIAATGSDLATLTVLVSVFHLEPRVANVPALVVGGVVNFLGNRYFAFRAHQGHAGKQVAGYTAVELVALGLNGVLFDAALRLLPGARAVYWLVRLATSHAVFLFWSYPLWRRVFAVPAHRDDAPAT
jgi:putative flippase GtrA